MPPISIGRLETPDRATWEQLFAGYHAFYGRPYWPQEKYDDARRLYDLVADNRGFIQYTIQL
jgi:hypothetical protein